MSDEPSSSVSIPLDSDGFLRRECPTCDREFKWVVSDDSEPVPAGGYFCPYCGVQAPEDEWWTPAQLDLVEDVAARDLTGPMLEQLARRTGARFESNVPTQPMELTEDDDMRLVELACHAGEPLKVLDDWAGPVHCLLCGVPSA